jgi:hypothetical protein
LVLDESWAVKSKSLQMRACRKLRVKRALKCTILNGTPLSNGKPLDLFWQFAILDPLIIGCTSKTEFLSKYAVMGGYLGKQTLSYKNLDDLNKRIAPYTLTRKTRECFDLPPMLPPITLEARLTPETWKIYCDQRDDMVSWLGSQASVSKQAIVKILRLSQITSGYLGGLETIDSDETAPPQVVQEELPLPENQPEWMKKLDLTPNPKDRGTATKSDSETGSSPVGVFQPLVNAHTREIGREKVDAVLHWLRSLSPTPDKSLFWCRFRPELERLTIALTEFYPQVLNLKGGQTPEERTAAKALLAPGSKGRGAVVGNQKAGGASLNFAAASLAVFMSNAPSLFERMQAIGRIERPGASQPMVIVDVVAVGPKGQRTIDHGILAALRKKDDFAKWTINEWRRILAEA